MALMTHQHYNKLVLGWPWEFLGRMSLKKLLIWFWWMIIFRLLLVSSILDFNLRLIDRRKDVEDDLLDTNNMLHDS